MSDRLFHCFFRFASPLFDTAYQLIVHPVSHFQVIVRELRPFLFELAFDDFPVAFNFEFVHDNVDSSSNE